MIFSAAQERRYVSADAFPLYGKISEKTLTRYERLPESLAGIVRPEIWRIGRYPAGMFIRFRSNSTCICARWECTDKKYLNHMTPCGTRGLDLYVLENGVWRFMRSGRPGDRITDTVIISDMDSEYREYMLYLSLYDGISSLEIGVDLEAEILLPIADRPSREKPIVMYGTSILQGGCASRPGMAHTNIISRYLDREVMNLGFSGNAFLDYEIAELMASMDNPGCFVLDYVPNASANLIRQKGMRFFRILRDAHPEVPVILVEAPEYSHNFYDRSNSRRIDTGNAALRELYETLKKSGEKNLYYVETRGLVGDDREASVDGVHLTDLGMLRYADHLIPVLKKALK